MRPPADLLLRLLEAGHPSLYTALEEAANEIVNGPTQTPPAHVEEAPLRHHRPSFYYRRHHTKKGTSHDPKLYAELKRYEQLEQLLGDYAQSL